MRFSLEANTDNVVEETNLDNLASASRKANTVCLALVCKYTLKVTSTDNFTKP